MAKLSEEQRVMYTNAMAAAADIGGSGSGDSLSAAAVLPLAENLRRVFVKMRRELEPGNDSHSSLIDLVNHGDSIAEQIEVSVMIKQEPIC
jgi:hypothetical protein